MAAVVNRDRDALLAHVLAGGLSLTAAAKLSGLSRATVARRMHDDEFRELLRREVNLLVEASRRDLIADAARVRGVLVEIACNSKERPMARIAAVRSIHEFGLRYTEAINIEPRLQALEAEWRACRNDFT